MGSEGRNVVSLILKGDGKGNTTFEQPGDTVEREQERGREDGMDGGNRATRSTNLAGVAAGRKKANKGNFVGK